MNWGLPENRHRVNGPVLVYEDGEELWLRHGTVKHRFGAPAVKGADGKVQWWFFGKLHNTNPDLPSQIDADGTKRWYRNNYLHRDGAPAVVYADGHWEWWFNSMLHRWDGPATSANKTVTITNTLGKSVTFHQRWSVYGIPTRFPHLCEHITEGKLSTKKLTLLTTHEDYVVAMLARHKVGTVMHVEPYNDELFFNLFSNLNDLETVIYDAQPERVSTIIATKKLFKEGEVFISEETQRLGEKVRVTMVDGIPHSIDGEPAVIWDIGLECWYDNGMLHRSGDAAVVNPDTMEGSWYENGLKSRTDGGPAESGSKGLTRFWWHKNLLHRLDGPAAIWATPATSPDGETYEQWWVNDVISHHPNLCERITWKNLTERELETYTNHEDYVVRQLAFHQLYKKTNLTDEGYNFPWGDPINEHVTTVYINQPQRSIMKGVHIGKKLHNPNGPAVIHADGDEEWWINGELRREDGGATIIRADGTQEWWVGSYQVQTITQFNPSMPALPGTPYLHNPHGPAIIYPPQHPKCGNVRFPTFWWNGETTSLVHLCEQAVKLTTDRETLYKLSTHDDYVVRKLAIANPHCPPEGKVLDALEN